MIIDMHNHTTRYSSCSMISPDILVETYLETKVDGICITEHNRLWNKTEQFQLKNAYKNQIQIFFGSEVNTDIGHVIVIGSDIEIYEECVPFDELEKMVDRKKTAFVWAHPFRWYYNDHFNVTQPFINRFDAVEYYNGNLSHSAKEMTEKTLAQFKTRLTGGSDTHTIEMAAKYATQFEKKITSQKDLVTQLKHGNYQPIIVKS
jgi:predicted metal-dependent phosphoesterase TrpH